MTVTEIPLINKNQTFNVTLLGATYRITVRWSPPASCWIMDIADNVDTPIVQGIPLITGVDLLDQYEYLGIGGQMIVQTDFDTFAQPTFNNLGSLSHLFFVGP